MKNSRAHRAMSFSTTGKYSFALILFLCMIVFSGVAHAQFNKVPKTDVNVEMFPTNPGPNQEVNVSIISYSTDINSANIVWKVNGTTLKTGRGQKTFTFKTGNTNTTTTLNISIGTVEGENIEKVYRIRPVGVDLTWESDSHVPPFYKGKAMFSHQSPITFIAIPHLVNSSGQEISAKNLIYKWSKNRSVMEAESGYGKNTYTMVGSLISRPIEIQVEVSSPNSSGVGFDSISVNPIEPSVVFYKKSPIYGIEFQKALQGTVELNDSKEIMVVSVPYYFAAINHSASELSYKWSINGVSVNNDPSAESQIFRQKEGTVGTSMISLSVEHASKILEVASSNFNLKFGSPAQETSQAAF